ncbi:hypothetical protein MKX54_15395 [Alkalihalobacillus sp. FSL R5-0424]
MISLQFQLLFTKEFCLHTAPTILINRGKHAKIISERLGHSKIDTTMDIYGHALRTADRSAAESIDDLFTRTGE